MHCKKLEKNSERVSKNRALSSGQNKFLTKIIRTLAT